MAYNWGTGLGGGLSGASTGAAVGAAFGGIGAPIGAAVGGGLGLLGGFSEQDQGFQQQINPYSQQYWDMATGNMANFRRQMQSELGQQESVLGRAFDVGEEMAAFDPTYRYDPASALRMTRAQLPQLQQLAEASLGDRFGGSPEAMQRQMTSAAQRTAGQFQQLGGLGSGAAAEAIGRAGADVAAQYGQQQQQMYQNSLMDLLGRSFGANQQGLQQQLAAQQAADQARFQGLQSGGAQMLDVGNLYGQRAGMFGDLVGQTQNSLASMSRPDMVYQPPSQTSSFGGLMEGFQGGASTLMLAQQLGLFGGNQTPTAGNDFSNIPTARTGPGYDVNNPYINQGSYPYSTTTAFNPNPSFPQGSIDPYSFRGLY